MDYTMEPTISVVMNEDGDCYLNDHTELSGHQWFEEGNYGVYEIPAIEPTKEEFAKWSKLPDSANGDMGVYLAYWSNYK